jgi:hypothetical protein
MPDYFFQIPASSSAKYHPEYATGEGGLLRHTVAAVRIAVELSRMERWGFSSDDMDLIITALILHDGWKLGNDGSNYTVTEHPNIASFSIVNNKELMDSLPEEKTSTILSSIETHMGQWNKNYKSGVEVLRKPETEHEKFVHLADYLASRKCLEMKFDVPLSRE